MSLDCLIMKNGICIARYFYAGIGRTGGVRPQKNPRQCDTMEQLCDRLGVPYDFFDEAWVLEEKSLRSA